MFNKRIFTLVIGGLLTTACQQQASLDDACASLDGLCAQLAPDPRCTVSRRNVLMTQYEMGEKPTTKQQLTQLHNLEKYVNCAALSAQIEYVDPAKRLQQRQEPGQQLSSDQQQKMEEYAKRLNTARMMRSSTYVKAKSMFDRLEHRTSFSNAPHLLYWHWTRHQDEQAVAKLVAMDERGELNSYDTAFFVAQEYARYDEIRAKEAMFRSLRLYPSRHYVEQDQGISFGGSQDTGSAEDKIHLQIFRGLMTMYFNEQKYANAYVFARLLKLNNDGRVDETENLVKVLRHYQKDVDELADIASTIHDMLHSDSFDSSVLPEPI